METTYTEQYYITKQLEKDLYYLRIAKTVSLRSKCLSRKIGSVLVKDDSIIGSGFNGPAKGVKHCNERVMGFYKDLNNTPDIELNYEYPEQCPRRLFNYKSGRGLHLCQAGHSERNAILQAARNGISTKDTTLYAFCGIPCKDCSIELVNAGIKEIVCLKKEQNYDQYAEVILQESGILLRTVDESLI
jgi:dCMP deaminase